MSDKIGFENPNYTQTPNDFFDLLPFMNEAEMRVTLIMIRNTFGFHRNGFKMGVTKMAKETGLSRQGVLIGAEDAEQRGTFRRANPNSQGEAEWQLIVQTDPLNTVEGGGPQHSRGGLNTVEGTPQHGRGQVGVKEKRKKESNAPHGARVSDASETDEKLPPAPTKAGVTKWPGDVWNLAVAFAEKLGRDPYPFEKGHWIKSLRTKYLTAGVTEDELRTCFDLALKDGISIKSPDSIFYQLNSVRMYSSPAPVEMGTTPDGDRLLRTSSGILVKVVN